MATGSMINAVAFVVLIANVSVLSHNPWYFFLMQINYFRIKLAAAVGLQDQSVRFTVKM